MVIRRGDIYYADLRPVIGSEQGGVRPVLVIQNDIGNKHSPTVICAAITSKMNKAKLPTHVELNTRRCAMVRDSVILLEQLRTIDKQRLKEKICHRRGAFTGGGPCAEGQSGTGYIKSAANPLSSIQNGVKIVKMQLFSAEIGVI